MYIGDDGGDGKYEIFPDKDEDMTELSPDIGKRMFASAVWPRLINYRALQKPIKGVKDLAAGERLGRKLTFSPFIPHGMGLTHQFC